MNAFSFQNILEGNGISISVTGMAIVFSGLIVITICISILPYVLNFNYKKIFKKTEPQEAEQIPTEATQESQKTSAAANQQPETDENDIASVIGLVLHLEYERLFAWDNQSITINRDSSQPTLWGKAGKMRTMPRRRNYAKI